MKQNSNTNCTSKRLLSISEILKMLNIKRTTFYNLRKRGAFPAPISITGSSRSPRWRIEDVEEFIEKARRNFVAMQQINV